MDDEAFLTYVMTSLAQEEYQATREESLSI